MTEAEIAHAKARAEDVINGFVQVRIQQAKDVVRLVNELQAADRRLLEIERKQYCGQKQGFQDDFGSVFESLMKGKKP